VVWHVIHADARPVAKAPLCPTPACPILTHLQQSLFLDLLLFLFLSLSLLRRERRRRRRRREEIKLVSLHLGGVDSLGFPQVSLTHLLTSQPASQPASQSASQSASHPIVN
jgi:hypothetical protein